MTMLWHALLFVPIAYLVMIVHVAPQADDAPAVLRLAAHKTVKVVFWTAVIIVAMQLIALLFLP